MTRLNQNINFFLLIKILVFYLLFTVKSYSVETKIQNDFLVVGSSNAPVKIKIFSSLTCPYCANFHIKVIPKIKENYVDSGKVQLIFIDFPLDQAAFNASKLLHCVDSKKQLKLLDTIYENQKKWTNGVDFNEINDNLKKMVKNLGINSDQFDKCLHDEVVSDKILNARINAQKKYSINSTPTIIINEKKLDGDGSFNNIKKKIERLI